MGWKHFFSQRQLFAASSLVTLILFSVGCEWQEQRVGSPEQELVFPNIDTLDFDTLFTGQTSVTKRFRVRNPNPHAVVLDNIRLKNQPHSSFSVYINGQKGKHFEKQMLFGKDSMLVLVNVALPESHSTTPLEVVDELLFSVQDGKEYKIVLAAWSQNVQREEQLIITEQTTWTQNERPRLIRKKLRIDSLAILNLSEGVKIFFDRNAVFEIKGTLRANGSLEKPISLEPLRADGDYKKAPGQWQGLVFLKNSKNNLLRHTLIRGANTGLLVGEIGMKNPVTLSLYAVRIQHMAGSGIHAHKSHIRAQNTLIFNCRDYVLYHDGGGQYEYLHCTFSNYPNGFFRHHASYSFSEFYYIKGVKMTNPLRLVVRNSVLWGSRKEDILTNIEEPIQDKIKTSHSLLRSKNKPFSHSTNLSSDDTDFPKFSLPKEHNYTLKPDSPLRDKAEKSDLKEDLLGHPRNDKPDIGAYEVP